jgi:hypothetical protein
MWAVSLFFLSFVTQAVENFELIFNPVYTFFTVQGVYLGHLSQV